MDGDAGAPPKVKSFPSNIPARLDRLPWSRFHTRICVVLGFTWALVGLVVTLVGTLDPAIRRALPLPENPMGLAVLSYLVGMALGAFLFSWATDRFGRRQNVFLTVL